MVGGFELGGAFQHPLFEFFIEFADFLFSCSPLSDVTECDHPATYRAAFVSQWSAAGLDPDPLIDFRITHKHHGRAHFSVNSAYEGILLRRERRNHIRQINAIAAVPFSRGNILR